MKKFTAPAIVTELIDLFSRHGIPEEILTDQRKQFYVPVATEIIQGDWTKLIRTSLYHPHQTDGLVEQFNQTLKQMMRQHIKGEGREWNKLIPYVLLAYREVPQASTGLSPFELIYGRDVRGPLDVLKGKWIQPNLEDDDIIKYVNKVHERLKTAKEIVYENTTKARKT